MTERKKEKTPSRIAKFINQPPEHLKSDIAMAFQLDSNCISHVDAQVSQTDPTISIYFKNGPDKNKRQQIKKTISNNKLITSNGLDVKLYKQKKNENFLIKISGNQTKSLIKALIKAKNISKTNEISPFVGCDEILDCLIECWFFAKSWLTPKKEGENKSLINKANIN